jgi:hypothetical protein
MILRNPANNSTNNYAGIGPRRELNARFGMCRGLADKISVTFLPSSVNKEMETNAVAGWKVAKS